MNFIFIFTCHKTISLEQCMNTHIHTYVCAQKIIIISFLYSLDSCERNTKKNYFLLFYFLKMTSKNLIIIFALISIVASNGELEDKLRTLTSKSAKDAVIRLSNDEYKRLARTAPRNYSIIIMLTALDQKRECEICSTSYPEYEILAKSWQYAGNSDKNLFFAVVDVDYGDGMVNNK
jgi:hypothetical protein